MIKRPPTKPRTKPKPCWCDGYWFPHRMSGGSCKLDKHGEYKRYDDMSHGNSAYDEGYQAARDGKHWSTCPYPQDSGERFDWLNGHDAYNAYHAQFEGAC